MADISDSGSERSETSYSDDHAEDDGLSGEERGAVTLPYQFEPRIIRDYSQYSSSDDDEGRQVAAEMPQLRVGNTEWCSCTKCSSMATEHESQCCVEIDEIRTKVADYSAETSLPLLCITDHPGFSTVCLDRYVLEVAYFQYREQYGEMANMNDRWRYVAYRQLARWCWGFLGKDVRVILPACAVAKIRETFPGDEYTGFKDA